MKLAGFFNTEFEALRRHTCTRHALLGASTGAFREKLASTCEKD